MTDRVSPSSLATYLTCPRQYEFNYDHDLEGQDRPELERYYNRGKVLDTALQQTADDIDRGTAPDHIRSRALEQFSECWDTITDSATYPSPASYEYDRQLSKAAIDAYLDPTTDGDGIEHLQRSVGIEVHLEWVDDELGPMHGYADNVVRTDDGLLIIDYKASYSGRRFPNKSGSDLTKQVAGERHYPNRLKKWLQIGMYTTGIKSHDLYSEGDTIRFLFYGLIDDKDRTPTPDGYTVSVEGKAWEMTELYQTNTEAFRTLVERSVEGIRSERFDPTGDRWELIQEEACEDCDYEPACGDVIAEEVRFE